jgi:hypothetical protein
MTPTPGIDDRTVGGGREVFDHLGTKPFEVHQELRIAQTASEHSPRHARRCSIPARLHPPTSVANTPHERNSLRFRFLPTRGRFAGAMGGIRHCANHALPDEPLRLE